MKKGGMPISLLVFLALTAIGVISVTFLFVKIWWAADEIPYNVIQCQQSAALSLQVGQHLPPLAQKTSSLFNIDFNKLPYVCPPTEFTVSEKILRERLDSRERAEFNKYNYEDEKKFNLDSLMWTEMQQCYQKMFYGENPLFTRNLVSSDEATFCAVCSIIEFDDEVITQFPKPQSFKEMFVGKNVPGGDVTLLEKSKDHPEVSGGAIAPVYRTYPRTALVYVRTNKPVFGNFYVDAQNAQYAVWDSLMQAAGADLVFDYDELYEPDPTYFEDFESMIFLNYETEEFIERHCNDVVAQLEEAQS